MATYRNYAQLNQLTVTGRVTDTTVRNGKNGEFLVVTLVSNITNEKSITVKFLDSGDIMRLYTGGKLPVGRIVTLTGTLDNVSEFYTDAQNVCRPRKRPEITLAFVTIPRGGLGPMPQSEARTMPPQRIIQTIVTPPTEELTPESEYSDNAADSAVAPVDLEPAF